MIVRELLAKLGLKVDQASFKAGDKATETTTGKLKALGAAAGVALAAIGVGLKAFVSRQVEAIDAIGKTSTQLGVNTESLQELAFAADLAGVEFTQFSQGLALLQKNAKEAKDGSTEFKEEFDRLGISVTDANGQLKDGPQLLEEMAESLSKVESSSEKVGVAQTLMGRSGRKLLPLFTNGAAGVRELREEAQELGFVLGEEDVRATEFLKDEMTRFERVTRGVKQQIFLGLLPTVTNLVSGAVRAGKAFTNWLKSTNLVKTGLLLLKGVVLALGATFLIAFAGPLLVLAKWVAIIGAILVVAEDLFTLFDGGRSVVGALIDEVFGLGAASAFVDNFRIGVDIMGESWRNAHGNVVSFFTGLLGFESDLESMADSMRSLGASVFEFLDRARIGIQNLLDTGIAKVVKVVAKLLGQDDVARAVDQQLAERVADRELGQRRTAGRGLRAQETATGLAGGAGVRGVAARQRLAARREQRALRRAAREAGVQVEGLTARGAGRTIGRGLGATEELTRFGVARAATAERRQAIELNQDNRNVITIDATGGDPRVIRERVTEALRERDERNRREANAAVSRTAR